MAPLWPNHHCQTLPTENCTFHLENVISFFLLLYPSSCPPVCPSVLVLSPWVRAGSSACLPSAPEPPQTSKGGLLSRSLLHLVSVLLSWLCELYPCLGALTMFEANVEHLCQIKQLWPRVPGLLSRALPTLCTCSPSGQLHLDMWTA